MSYFAKFFAVGMIVSLLGCSQSPILKAQVLPISARTRIADRLIELEVTKTPEQQAMGLMYRTSLADDRGMLFEHNPSQVVKLWMKNCKISLDMIFIRDGVVTAIKAGAPPCIMEPCPIYGPDTIVDRVIELRSGRATELGLKVGDRIAIEFF